MLRRIWIYRRHRAGEKMLHILWLIMKCMGIVLFFLLAAVLLVAVLVLFCPVRYRAKARKEAEEWECSARAGWLLGLVSVTVLKGSGDSCMQIRLFGVKLSTWKKLFTRKKRLADKQPVKVKQPSEKSQMEKQRAEKQHAEKQQPEERQVMDASGSPHSEKCTPKSAEPAAERKTFSEKAEDSMPHKPPKENLFKRLWQRMVDKYQSIRDALKRMVAAIRNLYGKIGLWKDFLGKSQTKAAFHLTWQQLLALLRHAGPQKWKGSVDLGLGDPAATGQVLAVLGAVYPIYGGFLSINPVWDRKVLEGNVFVKGRIYGVALLYAACRLYFDKNVKGAVQWIMQQVG